MNNMNLDKDMLDNLKNMVGEKNVNDALSQISPEMVESFSKMMANNNMNANSNHNNNDSNYANSSNNSFDFNNIDMATMMKIKSVIEKLNSNTDDPRSNLLNSLKPYMRDSRKENIDKYANILKMANITSMFYDEKKENNPND